MAEGRPCVSKEKAGPSCQSTRVGWAEPLGLKGAKLKDQASFLLVNATRHMCARQSAEHPPMHPLSRPTILSGPTAARVLLNGTHKPDKESKEGWP